MYIDLNETVELDILFRNSEIESLEMSLQDAIKVFLCCCENQRANNFETLSCWYDNELLFESCFIEDENTYSNVMYFN